jgi:hypothetical protein
LVHDFRWLTAAADGRRSEGGKRTVDLKDDRAAGESLDAALRGKLLLLEACNRT